MSNVITTTGRSISTVTAEIVAISNQAAQMAYMSMVEIGRRLVEAKALVDHGEWGDWLKNEVKFSQRTATNFMNIYQRSTEGNSQTFANLGYSQIVQLLALPDGELEEFTENHDVQSMSVRELKEAIAEEKRLRSEAEGKLAELTGQNSSLQATVSTLRNDTKLMENLNDALKVEANTLRNKVELLAGNEDKIKKAEERARKSEANALNLAEKYKKQLEEAQKQEKNLRAELEKARENPDIPESVMEQMRKEAEADAAKQVAEDLQKQVAAAEAAAQEAAKAREEAEAKLAAMKKDAKLADPDIAKFLALCEQLQEDYNRIKGLYNRTKLSDETKAASMRKATLALLEDLRKGMA